MKSNFIDRLINRTLGLESQHRQQKEGAKLSPAIVPDILPNIFISQGEHIPSRPVSDLSIPHSKKVTNRSESRFDGLRKMEPGKNSASNLVKAKEKVDTIPTTKTAVKSRPGNRFTKKIEKDNRNNKQKEGEEQEKTTVIHSTKIDQRDQRDQKSKSLFPQSQININKKDQQQKMRKEQKMPIEKSVNDLILENTASIINESRDQDQKSKSLFPQSQININKKDQQQKMRKEQKMPIEKSVNDLILENTASIINESRDQDQKSKSLFPQSQININKKDQQQKMRKEQKMPIEKSVNDLILENTHETVTSNTEVESTKKNPHKKGIIEDDEVTDSIKIEQRDQKDQKQQIGEEQSIEKKFTTKIHKGIDDKERQKISYESLTTPVPSLSPDPQLALNYFQSDKKNWNNLVSDQKDHEPVVTINIGRIEVRAINPPHSPLPTDIAKSRQYNTPPKMSLKEYLKLRDEGRFS